MKLQHLLEKVKIQYYETFFSANKKKFNKCKNFDRENFLLDYFEIDWNNTI